MLSTYLYSIRLSEVTLITKEIGVWRVSIYVAETDKAGKVNNIYLTWLCKVELLKSEYS